MWSREGTNNNQKGNGADNTNPGRSRSQGSRRGDIATGQERSESQGRTPREVDHATGWGLDPQHSRSSDDVRRSPSPRIIVTNPEVAGIGTGTAAGDRRVPTPTSAHSSAAPEIIVTEAEHGNTGRADHTSPEIDITNPDRRRSSSHRRSLDAEHVNIGSPEIDITNPDRRRSSSQHHSLDIEHVNTGSADHTSPEITAHSSRGSSSQRRSLDAEHVNTVSADHTSPEINEAPQNDVNDLLRRLIIKPGESGEYHDAERVVRNIYGIVQKMHEVEKNLRTAQQELLALSPRAKSTVLVLAKQGQLLKAIGRLLCPPHERIEEKIGIWEAQLKIADLDTSTRSGSFRKKFIKANNWLARPLKRRLWGGPFAIYQAAVGSIYPLVATGEIVWAAVPTNLISFGFGNRLFQEPFPFNAIMDNAQWQALSIIGLEIQRAIQGRLASYASSQVCDLMASQVCNLTTSQLGHFLPDLIGNCTTSQVSNVLTLLGNCTTS